MNFGTELKFAYHHNDIVLYSINLSMKDLRVTFGEMSIHPFRFAFVDSDFETTPYHLQYRIGKGMQGSRKLDVCTYVLYLVYIFMHIIDVFFYLIR